MIALKVTKNQCLTLSLEDPFLEKPEGGGVKLTTPSFSRVNVFDSLIPLVMLKIFRFKSSVLFGTYTLLDKPLRVLPLPKYLSKLTAN